MKFGSVDNPEEIDLSLPEDHPETAKVLSNSEGSGQPQIYVGCAKWNRQDLKNFYPRGTKDELTYYATQFNSVEMNATYHRSYSPKQYSEWREKAPEDFRFFPKVDGYISHRKWLNEIENRTDDFLSGVTHLEENLGTIFLQLSARFAPKFMDRVTRLKSWTDQSIKQIDFFVHQNEEIESPKLSAYFIQKLNKALGKSLPVPRYLNLN